MRHAHDRTWLSLSGIIVAGLVLNGCDGPTSSGPGVEIRTDAAAYQLQPELREDGTPISGMYQLVIPVEIHNFRDEPVYLSPLGVCPGPFRYRPMRPGGVDRPLALQWTGYACLGVLWGDWWTSGEPVPIAAGEVYTDSVFLYSPWLEGNTWATMEDLLGPVQLEYELRSEFWEAYNTATWQEYLNGQGDHPLSGAPPLPLEERLSNVFQVEPPPDL